MDARYPAWKYHRDGRSLIVRSADEETALGPGWFNSPDEARTPVEVPPAEMTTEAIIAEIEVVRQQIVEAKAKVSAETGERFPKRRRVKL